MSNSSYVKDVEAERLALTQKLRDKGVDEVVEEISARLAMEAKQRRDLIESVRRLTDENGELRARLALARGQHGGTETHPVKELSLTVTLIIVYNGHLITAMPPKETLDFLRFF